MDYVHGLRGIKTIANNYRKWPNKRLLPNKENYAKILGISKKEQNHSIHSVFRLALLISFCSLPSSKQGYTNNGKTIMLSKDSHVDVGIWKGEIDL